MTCRDCQRCSIVDNSFGECLAPVPAWVVRDYVATTIKRVLLSDTMADDCESAISRDLYSEETP
jgi:hypothetical protein